jgi:hypothetical protein
MPNVRLRQRVFAVRDKERWFWIISGSFWTRGDWIRRLKARKR